MKVEEFRDKLIQSKSLLNQDEINQKFKQNFITKWGVDNPSKLEEIKEKKRFTSMSNWGVENPFQSQTIKEKIRQTNLDNYGVDHPLQSDEKKQQLKETSLMKFGVDNPMKSEEIKTKFRRTCKERWGYEHFFKSPLVKMKIEEKTIKKHNNYFEENNIPIRVLASTKEGFNLYCSSCENEFKLFTNTFHVRKKTGENICIVCNPLSENTSFMEKSILNFIKENYSGEIIPNHRIANKEIDIYLPELKLGIEYNGVYWHSSKFKDKEYHSDKMSHFQNQGISIINVWEDDFIEKKNIIESMILNRIGMTPNKIGARLCDIRLIEDNKLVRDFLNSNHIQGFVGAKVKIGLFYNDELISLMTFGELRKSLGYTKKEGEWELIRFCNKLNTNVVGGASKLLNFFKQNYSFNKIVSYSKNDYSNGNLYKMLGFNFDSETPPNYYWVIGGKRINRFNFRKDKLVKQGENPLLTENEIMENKGFYKVYDSGNKKWVFTSENLCTTSTTHS